MILTIHNPGFNVTTTYEVTPPRTPKGEAKLVNQYNGETWSTSWPITKESPRASPLDEIRIS